MIYLASLVERTEDKIEGYVIIKTRKELDAVVADTGQVHKVIINRDFANEYFTPTGLQKFITNARKINRGLRIELNEQTGVLTNVRFTKKLQSAKTLNEMLMLLTAYPEEFVQNVNELASKKIDSNHELLIASETVSRLQSTIDKLRSEKDELQHALDIESKNKAQVQAKLDVLMKRINLQHGAGIEERYLFNVDANNFDKVLYIKEITRVQFTDSLIYYLKEIFKILYGMPTRLLVIESYYGYKKASLYPDLVPHYNLKEKDVISGDILMCGMQPKLMTDILKNTSNISILIVLDRCGYEIPHIKGENVQYLYTISDIEDAPSNIPKTRLISYEPSTLNIPYINGFKDLDAGEKITKYSSLPIVQQITALMEGR